MSPEEKHEFEAAWPELASRLQAFLARKRIPVDQREDLVQETGARLVGIWDTVDRGRPTWPLAMTVALNLVRDRARRSAGHEIVAEIPDMPQAYDLEEAGMARLELDRVRSAMSHLSSRQQEVLLAEIGVGGERLASDKMTRSRARRKLNHLVGRISAGLSFQWRRFADMLHAAVGAEGALQGIGCSACALLAMSAVLVPHTAPAMSGELHTGNGPVRELVVGGSLADRNLALSGASAGALRDAAFSAADARAGSSRTATKAKKAPSTDPASMGTNVPSGTELPPLPGGGRGTGEEVPVPQPPGPARQLVEKVLPTVRASLPL
jgi:hypothetical protein